MSQIKTKYIQNNAVTNAKAAQMNARTLKGNNTLSTANASDLTITQLQALLGLPVNYISDPNNSNFELSIGDWIAYADAAASSPVDGTGGSPNLTVTRTTSSPLAGSGSGLITKDAANRQGQGGSLAFSIDAEAKNQRLKIRWSYEASANYTGFTGSEYMVCFVYDVTNGVLIPASTIYIPQGSGIQETAFDSSTSTSYRLIFHVAGTGTSSWTYKFDNVVISTNQVVSAPAITDWQPYVPTLVGFGTTTNQEFWWARVGDTLYVRGSWQNGTVTGVEARVPFPTGLTSASSSVMQAAGVLQNGNTTSDNRMSLFIESSVSYFTMGRNSDLNTKSNGNSFNNSERMKIVGSAKISGWSSGIQLENSRIEYASNSGMGNADDTTNFVNDPNGSPIPTVTYTAARAKRVRFKNPIQATDTIQLQVKMNNSLDIWQDFSSIYSDPGSTAYISTLNTATGYGFGIRVIVNSTDVDITFDQFASASLANWSGSNTSRWRLVKYSNAIPVGFSGPEYKEVKDVVGTANMTTSGQYKDMGSILLQPGEYDLSILTNIFYSGAGNLTFAAIAIGTVAGNSLTPEYGNNISRQGGTGGIINADFSLSLPNFRVLITTPTTYYAKILGNYTSTASQYGFRFSVRKVGAVGITYIDNGASRFVGSAIFSGSRTYSRTNTALGSFGATTTLAPTVLANPGPGTIATTSVTTPLVTVNGLKAGTYRVKVTCYVFCSSSGQGANIAINDGTTTGPTFGVIAPAASRGCSITATAYFSYGSDGNKTFEVYASATSGSANIELSPGSAGDLLFEIEKVG